MAPSLVGIGPIWLDRRQAGLKNPLGTKNHIYKQIYSNILPYGSWDHTFNNTYTSVHGGVFCLEFSPDGSLLVAACEKRSVLMFDPLTHKRIQSVENAHSDCVNCVKFLDSRSFATSSDDFTVALWDARNLNQKVRSLKGHSNWVKNIEYSPTDGLLVTSGFDGSVLTWEMNTYRENGTVFNKVFSTNGLMRTCLTPDASKMVICTTGGYLIVIHNLNLNTLGQDLDGFKPNMYRLMQLSQTILPIASDFTDLFRGRGKRNRVEFITDFPEGDDAEVVSSLQIHPDGHCAISRNVSNNEKSEWSCIHNIEESFSSDDESDFTDCEEDCDDGVDDDNEEDEEDDDDDDDINDIGDKFKKKISMMSSWPGRSTSVSTTPSYIIQHSVVENDRFSGVRGENGDEEESVSPSDVWEALVAIQEARFRRESESNVSEMSMGHMFRRQFSGTDSPYRPSISERQIFVHRILPNLETGRERGPGSAGEQTAASSNVRNTFTNGADTIPPETGSRGCGTSALKFWRRKKLLLSQRYASLYRRSLVGLYDRTSVLRKPIYHNRGARLSVKKLKNNYKFKESRKFRNQNERNLVTLKFSAVLAERRNTGASINRWVRRSVPATPSRKCDQKNMELKPGIINPERRTVSTSGSRKANLNGCRDVRSPSDPNEENMTTTTTAAGVPHTRSVSSTSAGYGNVKTVLMGMTKANNRHETRENIVGNNDVTTVTVSSSAKTNFCSVSGENSRREKRNYKLGIKKNNNANSQKRNRNNFKTKDKIRNRMTSPLSTKIHRNTKRLTHYVEEPNLGRGFIKELCFSPDGRIICSPFGNGIRLLSFSPTVQDIFHCYPPSPPIPLHELSLNVVHSDTVVSTKFSPFHNLLVSGCLSGKIVYYQPFL